MTRKKITPPRTVKKQQAPTRTQSSHRAVKVRGPLTSFFQPDFWQNQWLPASVLIALALVLYGLTLGFGYLQDDQLVIWDNDFVQKGFAGLRQIFAHDSLLGYYKDPKLLVEGGRYRPFPLATYAMEIGLFGKDHPGIGHFINVLLYGSSGVLIYRILSGLFPVSDNGSRFFNLPFLAAVIFMLHPLHVEVVANIKGRDEILALLGSLGALYFTLKYFDTARNKHLLYAGLCFFLGLLSKENTITFLAIIPLSLWMFSKVPAGRIGASAIVLLLASALFILIRYKALGYMVNQVKPLDTLVFNPFFGMNGAEKMATIFLSLGWYIKLLFVPHPLTHDYYPYHVPKINWSDWRAGMSLLLYALMALWAIWQMRKARAADAGSTQPATRSLIPAYSILYFILTISIVSNIFVDTSTFLNERLAYMPSLGFCLLLAWFLAQQLPQWLGGVPDRPALLNAGLFGIIAVLFAIRVWTRLPDWGGKGEGLVESAIRIAPDSYRANYYYAAMLYQEQYLAAQNNTDAGAEAERKVVIASMEQYVDRALNIYPDYRLAVTLKANVSTARYRQDKQLDKLLQDFESLIQRQPMNGDMLIIALDVLKSLKGSDPNLYNAFCHRIGYNLYFKQRYDLNGALEFLNLALANYPQDEQIVQDLLEVYTATDSTPKIIDMQQRLKALKGNAVGPGEK